MTYQLIRTTRTRSPLTQVMPFLLPLMRFWKPETALMINGNCWLFTLIVAIFSQESVAKCPGEWRNRSFEIWAGRFLQPCTDPTRSDDVATKTYCTFVSETRNFLHKLSLPLCDGANAVRMRGSVTLVLGLLTGKTLHALDDVILHFHYFYKHNALPTSSSKVNIKPFKL